jgi:hypothetical protein
MKPFLQELLISIFGIIYFIIISVPLAITILIIAHLVFIIKKLTKWIIN